MANKNALTSIGLVVAVAVETTAGTRPVTNYYKVPGVTDLPDLDFDPDTIETTSYDNLDYKSYLPGLKDTGGVVSLEANYTEYGVGLWDGMTATIEADTTGIKAWILIAIKGTTTRWMSSLLLCHASDVNAVDDNAVIESVRGKLCSGIVYSHLLNSTVSESDFYLRLEEIYNGLCITREVESSAYNDQQT